MKISDNGMLTCVQVLVNVFVCLDGLVILYLEYIEIKSYAIKLICVSVITTA